MKKSLNTKFIFAILLCLWSINMLCQKNKTNQVNSENNAKRIQYDISRDRSYLIPYAEDGFDVYYMHKTDTSLSYLILTTSQPKMARFIHFNPDIVYFGDYNIVDNTILFNPIYNYHSYDSITKQTTAEYLVFTEIESGELTFISPNTNSQRDTIVLNRVSPSEDNLPNLSIYKFAQDYIAFMIVPPSDDYGFRMILVDNEQRYYDALYPYYCEEGSVGSYTFTDSILELSVAFHLESPFFSDGNILEYHDLSRLSVNVDLYLLSQGDTTYISSAFETIRDYPLISNFDDSSRIINRYVGDSYTSIKVYNYDTLDENQFDNNSYYKIIYKVLGDTLLMEGRPHYINDSSRIIEYQEGEVYKKIKNRKQ